MKNNKSELLKWAIKNDTESINRKIYRRWYDDDPVLSSCLSRMEHADSDFREKVAMKLINLIIKYNIEMVEFNSADEILRALYSGYRESRNSRWYDADVSVKTAIGMLRDCPVHIRKQISGELKKFMINLDCFPI